MIPSLHKDVVYSVGTKVVTTDAYKKIAASGVPRDADFLTVKKAMLLTRGSTSTKRPLYAFEETDLTIHHDWLQLYEP